MSFQTCRNFFLLWNTIWEIQDIFVHTVEIKGNQNGLVTFYKILFCVPQSAISELSLSLFLSVCVCVGVRVMCACLCASIKAVH